MTNVEKIPEGWKIASLGSIAFPSDRKVDPKKLDDVCYVGLEHIEKETGRLLGTGKSNEVTSTKSVFEKGDLLYGKLRPYLNKVWVAEFDGVCSTDILVFRPSMFALNKFLFYRLLSSDFVRYAHQNSTGVNHPRTSFKAISDFKIPLPPLAEQERIVARIEELFTQLDAGVAALEAVKGRVRRYRQAVLQAAVTGKLTEIWRRNHTEQQIQRVPSILFNEKVVTSNNVASLPKIPPTWRWISPVQLASKDRHALTIGPFGSDLKVSDYRDYGVPLVFVRNIRSGLFNGSNTRYISEEKAERLKAHRVIPGDVLITKMGEPPGDACLYPDLSPPGIITADCIKLTLDNSFKNRGYFVHAINSRIVKNQIIGITKGVAQKKVSLERFKSVLIPLPPLEELDQIVEELEKRFTIAEHVEKNIELSLRQAARLRQSILQRAFTGKLISGA